MITRGGPRCRARLRGLAALLMVVNQGGCATLSRQVPLRHGVGLVRATSTDDDGVAQWWTGVTPHDRVSYPATPWFVLSKAFGGLLFAWCMGRFARKTN